MARRSALPFSESDHDVRRRLRVLVELRRVHCPRCGRLVEPGSTWVLDGRRRPVHLDCDRPETET